ncbi:hypothetical protein EX30DRAFT_314483 [Ascodesmis nigricans]|uniref:Cytoskeleton organization protein n=1 Tax=Ascodesmis nigricans TaxID=341454 RepID=A0A4V6RHJ3_9PEZI|nr:hypothetical protein EX30DRAFT_314483 [Ascodesmis nigricans]
MSSAPADRKNQMVRDQIEAGQFKQALQLCNRRIKKGEKTEYLWALKAFVLTQIPGPANAEEAEQLARTLSDKTPPVVATDVLGLLTRVWVQLEDTAEVLNVWERAVKSQPQNEDLARDWFFMAIRMEDWRGAQKAAMNLQTKHTKRRDYFFWAIVSCLLLHNSLPEGVPERKLFGTLAYRMIDKARNDTPADTTIIPARGIQTSQEINLMLELIPHINPQEADKLCLEVLNSNNLGVDSTVGSGDWWGLARKRLDLLEKTEDWKTLYALCKSLLPGGNSENGDSANGEQSKREITGRGDDWRVWKGFVQAAGKLYDAGDKSVSQEALEKIVNHRKIAAAGSSRNGDLALVKFASFFHDKSDGPEGTPTLQEAVEEYFDRICTKNCCFEDLQEYLEMLEDVEQQDFLKYVEKKIASMPQEMENQTIDAINAIINQQKFIYLTSISKLDTASPATTKTVTAFVTANIQIYTNALQLGTKLLVTDNQYGDDAALLSVMGLIRLFTLTPTDQAPLYQSIVILETLLQKSKHNYQALLLLVRLYLLIGSIGQAVTTYPRLNIKQVQNDTLSHYLTTRISTLLPNDRRVSVLISDALEIYDSSRAQSANMLQLGFERGGYAQMMGFIELSQRIAGSVCRTMGEIELHRISRLTSTPSPEHLQEVGVKGQVWDNRDFDVILNSELSSKPSFESTIRLGPKPAERWALSFAAVESIVDSLKTGTKPPYIDARVTEANGNGNASTVAAQDPSTIITLAINNDIESPPSDREFTSQEIQFLRLLTTISDLVTAVHKKSAESVTSLLEQQLLPSTLDSLPTETPDWSLLHTLWLTKDSCIVVALLVDFLRKHAAKVIKSNALTGLKEAAGKMKKDVEEKAREVVKELEDEEREQKLVDQVLSEEGVGKWLRKEEVWGGVEKVVERVGRVREGIREAVRGVSK